MIRLRDEGLELAAPGWPPVWIHWSMPAITLLLTFGLWLPFRAPGLWTAAMVIPGIMLSILAHELGHAIVARRNGVGVSIIELHAGGGVARLKGWAWSRAMDRRITIAGPAVNLALAATCLATYWLLWVALDLKPDDPRYPSLRGLLRPPWARALWWLGWFNLVLALVNLLPALPLDGGRLARSFLEPRIGALKAQYWVGLSGTILAVVSGFVFIVTLIAGVPVYAPPYLRPNLRAYRAARAGRRMPSDV